MMVQDWRTCEKPGKYRSWLQVKLKKKKKVKKKVKKKKS